VLRIAYSHAIMHANRFFLLGNYSSSSSEMQVTECVMAAKTVLEIVDGLARDSPIFHAFWWTHYVTFCALVVTYAWEIQQQTQSGPGLGGTKTPFDRAALLDLAERCQTHLAQATATNSPSRRYAIILEELRSEAQRQSGRCVTTSHPGVMTTAAAERGALGGQSLVLPAEQQAQSFRAGMGVQEYQPTLLHAADGFESLPGNPVFEAWNMTDWLELDSSVRPLSVTGVCSRVLH
jgi:hypothetical protein